MITIYDHQIFHVNRSKTENEGDSLIYKDKNGVLHQIDFEICAKNYSEANRSTGGRCIGERNIEQGYFLLYTGGMQTKLVAAGMVMEAGCDMIIANGENPDILYDILDGKTVGTRFVGKK